MVGATSQASDDGSTSSTTTAAPTSLFVSPASFQLATSEHAWSDESQALDCAQGTEATDDAMRIESGVCRYGVWSAPLEVTTAVRATRVSFTFWHDGLVAIDPNEAAAGHFGLAIDDVVIVDVTEEIPGAPAWRDVDVALSPPLSLSPSVTDRGARLDLHLHNHGANHWGVSPIVVELEGEQP